jgi:hypothetical protein
MNRQSSCLLLQKKISGITFISLSYYIIPTQALHAPRYIFLVPCNTP